MMILGKEVMYQPRSESTYPDHSTVELGTQSIPENQNLPVNLSECHQDSKTSTLIDPLRNVRSYNTFKSHLNWYYAFQSTSMQKLYQEFHTLNRSTGTFYFVVGLFFVGILLPIQISETINDLTASAVSKANPKYPYRVLTSWVLLCVQFIGVVLSWFLASYHVQFIFLPFYNRYLARFHERTFQLFSYFFKLSSMNDLIVNCTYIELAAISTYFIFFMIQTCLGLNCVTPTSALSDAFATGECYSGPALYNAVFAHGILVLILPLCIAVNMPELSAKFIWANFWLSFIAVVLVAVGADQTSCLSNLLLWAGVSFFSIVDALIRNITLFFVHMDLHEALNEVKRMEKESRANEMRSMIANVAHDLKTPLASFVTGMDYIHDILRSVQSFFRENVVDASMQQSFASSTEGLDSISTCLRSMKNTNAFMLMMINRCIDYTKASKGISLIPHYETISLLESVQLPMDCMSNLQERLTIHLDFLPSNTCPYVITDKQWLQENVLCLLSNAVKYSTHNTVNISMKVSSAQELPSHSNLIPGETTPSKIAAPSNGTDLYVECSIEDEGIGIPPELQTELFQPFRQAQRLTGGTGLGLYSLAMRMKALNGYYGVHNRSDGKRGSVFWFAFPYRPDRSTQEMKEPRIVTSGENSASERYQLQSSPKNSSSVEAVDEKNKKVLIVDDSPAIIKMTTMMLKRKGYDITAAENGQIAVEKVLDLWKDSQSQFDVILMDLQMPVMDGLEATRRIRQFEQQTAALPQSHLIIGMSANSDSETVEAGMKAGLSHFLAKPFNITSFQYFFISRLAKKDFMSNE